MRLNNVYILFFFCISIFLVSGCASTEKPVRTIAKPIKAVNDELGKERNIGKSEDPYAVLAPQDDKKLRISF